MILLYSILACGVVLGGLIITFGLAHTDYADASGISSFQHIPEEYS